MPTGLAVEQDSSILDDNIGLGVLAFLAENKLVDEAIKIILKLGGLMSTVDDPAIIGRVGVGLSSELEPEVLNNISPRTSQRLGDTAKIDNDGLDTVSLAFDLGLKSLHLVAIEGILHIAANIDGGHGCGCAGDPGITSDVVLRETRRDFDVYATG